MHWLDTTLLAALSVGAVLGFVSGLFYQLARIASFALAVTATILLHEPATQMLREALLRDADASIVAATAYAAVFLSVYLVLLIVTRLLRTWLRSTDLAPLDRLLGAGLGLAKVALLLGLFCWTLPHWPQPGPRQWHAESALAGVFARSFDAALVRVPDDYKEPILQTLQSWRKSVFPIDARRG